MTEPRKSKWDKGLGMLRTRGPGFLKRGVFVALGLYVCLLTGCHDADRYVLTSDDSVNVSDLFTVTVEGDTVLAADGFSETTLVARVKDVTEGPRSILFVTTAGFLRLGSRVSADSALVQTDASGVARVDLVSSRDVTTARVMASVLGVRTSLVREVSISFRAVSLDDVIRFIDVPDTAVADPDERMEVTAWISPKIEGEDRLVVFQTSNGRFEFASGDGRSRTVRADADGFAKAMLLGPDQSSEVLITATVKGFTQEAGIRFFSPPTIQFVEIPTSAPADGETLSRIAIAIPSNLQSAADRQVDFETTAGHFTVSSGPTASVQADSEDLATVFLRSPTRITLAVVTVRLQDVVEERSIRFEPALPDSIVLAIESDTFYLRPSEQVRINADLLRAPGRGLVTEGLVVSFAAVDTVGNALDRSRFFNVTPSNTEGRATAFFTPDSTAYRGLVTITAELADFPGSGRGDAVLRIVD